MLVKITQPGWESYNGPLCAGVMFENGVSTDHVSFSEAMQLGAMISVVEIDAEGNEMGPVSPAHEIVRTRDIAAEIEEPLPTEAAIQEAEMPHEPEGATDKTFTEEELEAIAEEHGIGGLRLIGDRLGVKNTSIKGLIREIIVAQNGN